MPANTTVPTLTIRSHLDATTEALGDTDTDGPSGLTAIITNSLYAWSVWIGVHSIQPILTILPIHARVTRVARITLLAITDIRDV